MNKLLSFVPKNNDCDFERISRLQSMMYHRKATLCYERGEIITRVFKETEDEPMIIRKAKAFAAIMREMSIYIEPDSIIVGNQACRNFAAPIFPEYSIKWIVEEMDEFEKRSGDAFFVDEETKEHLLALAPYWMGKTHQDKVIAELPKENRLAEEQGVIHRGGISMSGDGHIAPNFEFVFEQISNFGAKGVRTSQSANAKLITAETFFESKNRYLGTFTLVKIPALAINEFMPPVVDSLKNPYNKLPQRR